MAIATTGSLVYGCVQGIANGISNTLGEIQNVNGNPNGKLTWTPVSGIVFDSTNGTFYMYKGGSTWSGLQAA